MSCEPERWTCITKEFLNKKEYTDISWIGNKVAEMMYRRYLCEVEEANNTQDIEVKDDLLELALDTILEVARFCEIDKNDAAAKKCREAALQIIEYLLTVDDDSTLYIMHADTLRRLNRFDEVISKYRGVKFKYFQRDSQLLEFQVLLSEKKDNSPYLIYDLYSMFNVKMM